MERRLYEYLRQIRTAAQDSIQFVDGISYTDFQADTKTQRAVTMNLVILGEAAAKIEEHFPEFAVAHPEIAWTAIRGMRNRIVHEYFILNFETIWTTVEAELPRLMRQVESVLQSEP
ncbi:MAG: DUF86 domain-containing protein [Acidobacteriaceae bacterium]|jgi:uncharacterized protein with HEPN domain